MLTKLFVNTKIVLENYKNNEQGVTAIEYGLIAVAMAVLVSTAVDDGGFISKLEGAFTQVANTIEKASN